MMTLQVELERLLIKMQNILFERSEQAAAPEADFELWLEDQLHEVVLDLKRILDTHLSLHPDLR